MENDIFKTIREIGFVCDMGESSVYYVRQTVHLPVKGSFGVILSKVMYIADILSLNL